MDDADRSLAELLDPGIARAADAFRASAGPIDERAENAPNVWVGTDGFRSGCTCDGAGNHPRDHDEGCPIARFGWRE